MTPAEPETCLLSVTEPTGGLRCETFRASMLVVEDFQKPGIELGPKAAVDTALPDIL
jgi:hypothetical protein